MRKCRILVILFVFLLSYFASIPKASAQSGIVNPKKVYTYSQMVNDLKRMKQKYPDLVQVQTIGKSEYGRDLYAISLGKGPATVFVNGSHHAREWLTTTLNMYMIEKYADAYKKNQKIKGYNARKILNSTTMWFVPMVNPDGVTLQQFGLSAFPKNAHKSLIKMNEGSKNFKRWKANGKGIDLNRQYNAGWNSIKSPSSPKYSHYKGKAPETAAETKAILRFVSQTNPEMAVSYHSSGKILFWNYKQDKARYKRDLVYAKSIGKMTGYSLVYPGKNPSGGGFTDWFIQTKKRPAFTPEIARYVVETSPPLSEFAGSWKVNQAVGLYTAQESTKLFDNRMKKSADNLAVELRKLKVKAKKLKNYYHGYVKEEKHLKIDKTFKSLYDSVSRDTRKLESQSNKLPAKYSSSLSGYFKSIKSYSNYAKFYIDGNNAGGKLSNAMKQLDARFSAGKLDSTTISTHKALTQSVVTTEKSISKMYGKLVRSLASKKYVIPAKNTADNAKLELDRYSLTLEIGKQLKSGQTETAKNNYSKLKALEVKSAGLKKKDPKKYKRYRLVEEKLTKMKLEIERIMNEKEGVASPQPK